MEESEYSPAILILISLFFEHWRRVFLSISIILLIVDRHRAFYAAMGKSAKIHILAHIALGAFALLLLVIGVTEFAIEVKDTTVALSSMVCPTYTCYNVLTILFNSLITGAFLFVFVLTMRLLFFMNRSKISDKVRKIFCLQMKY